MNKLFFFLITFCFYVGNLAAQVPPIATCTASLKLDGIDDYGSIPFPFFQNLYQRDFTIEFYLKPDAQQTQYAGVWGKNSYYGEIDVEFFKPGKVEFLYGTPSQQYFYSDTVSWTANNWDHYAIVGDQINNEIRIYKNGILGGIKPYDTPYWGLPLNDSKIGAIYQGWVAPNIQYLKGRLDDFRVSDIPRYTGNFIPPQNLTTDANTRVFYNFNNVVNGVVSDLSGNNNHLTLHNGASLDFTDIPYGSIGSTPVFSFNADTLSACGSSLLLNAAPNLGTYLWSNGDTTSSTTATTTGWYSLTVNNGTCSSTDSIFVSLVNAQIQQNDTTICSGASLTLSVAGAAGVGQTPCLSSLLPANLQNGLVGYWPFCGNANDESGNGNNGVVNGATLTTDRFGNANSSYRFLTSNTININSNSSLQITQNISISLWVYLYNNGETLIRKGNDYGVDIGNSNDSQPGTYLIFFPPNLFSSTFLPIQTWSHIVSVKNGNNRYLYINGALSSSSIINWNFLSSSSPLTIGSWNNELIDAKLDEISLWNRALNTSEIQQLYNNSQLQTYLWSTGDTTATINVTPTQNTSYWVQVSNGITICTDTIHITVNNFTNLIAQDTISACGNGVTINATPGLSSYSWSGGGNTASKSVTATGWYSLTTSNGTCTATDSVFVSLVNAQIQQNDTVICSGATLTLSVAGAAGVGQTLCSSSLLPSNLQNGLVGYWPFCGNANDESGNGNNGVVNGATLTTDRFGNAGKAYFFNGVSDFISVPNSNSINIVGNQITISYWFFYSNNLLDANYKGISKGGWDNGLGYEFQFRNGNDGGNLDLNSAYGGYSHNPMNIYQNQWIHVLGTFNGNVANFYINGMPVTTIPAGNGISSFYSSAAYPLLFGKRESTNCCPGFLLGKLDDIAIWNRYLTPQEVNQLYIASSQANNSYLWSTGDSTATINANPSQSTTYWVQVSNGITTCTDTIHITVNNLSNLIAQDTISACGSIATINATPGLSSYSWSGGGNTASKTVTATGWYSLTASNGTCTATDSVFVSLVNAQIQQNDTTICNGSNLILSVNSSGTQSYNSCTGISQFNYTTWTPIAPLNSYVNLIKEGSVYYLRAQNDVVYSNTLNGPWSSLNFSSQTGIFNAGSMLGFDWLGQLWVSTYHNSLFAYNNGTWVDKGLGGFGCSGSLLTKLANGRIIVQKSGYLRDLYISDNSGNNWTNVTNVDNDYRDMMVATNGYVYAGGGSGTLSMTGLIRSTDNGSSFSQVNNLLGISNAYQFAKDCSGALYVIGDNKIFKTIDGINWNFICLLPANVTPSYDLFNFVVASNGDYYLSLTNNIFYKSNNQGVSWQLISSVPAINASVMEMKEIDGNLIAITTEGVFAITLSQINPNSFLWSTGDTSASINVNPTQSTSYWVQVSNGITTCTDTIHVTVNQPVISINAMPNDTVCSGQTLTLSGQGASTYTWSGGVNNGVGFVPASSATYTVTGTDALGCSATKSIAIVVQSAPIVTANANPSAICSGNSTTLSAVGGTTYVWQPGNLLGSPVVSPNNTTTYTVTATNANGCSNTATKTLVVNSLPVVSATANPSSICIGASSVLSATGGTSYTWQPGGLTGSPSVTPITTTTYTVTAVNANGCSNTATQTITVNSLPTVSANANPSAICIGASSVLSATGGISYTWQPGNLTGSPSVSPTTTTTYTVTVVNANGCSNTATQTIVVNPLPIVSALANPTFICIGESSALSATGGTSYTWQPGNLTGSPSVSPITTTTYTVTAVNANGCNNTATQTIVVNPTPIISASANPSSICIGASSVLSATGGTSYTWQPGNLTGSPSVSPTTTTTYTVTALNANGCSNTATQTIVVNPLPTVSVSANPTSICIGASSVLSATGGTSYTWQPGNLTGSPSVSPTTITTYTVTAVNANGCSNTATQTITVNSLPTVSVSANPTSICIGASSVLSATGGTSYTWQPGNLTGSPSVSPTTITTYTVTAVNANGCSNTATQTITVNSLPTVSANANPSAICIGASSVLSASGGVNYIWQPGGLTGSPSVSPSTTTTYTVTASNANGCSQTSTITVDIINGPSISVSASPASVCLGGSTTLTALGGQNYIWQPGSLGGSPTVSPAATTTYTVTASNVQGCTNVGTLTVTVNNLPAISAVANPNNVCAGSTTQLSASGGTTYQWQPGNLVGAPVVNPSISTTYTVVGTDNNGCSNTNTVSIQVNALPNVGATINPNVICAGGAATLQGIGASSYYWMPGNIFGAPMVFPNVTTTYTVTGTAANGCTATSSATLTVDPPPVITQNPANQTSVNGSTAQFTVQCNNPNATYLWQRDNGLGFQNLSNGGQYSGVNTNTLTISNLTQANNGNWFRCQVSLPGCNVISTQAILKVDFALGLDLQNTNPSIHIYPNPANNTLHIHAESEAIGSQLQIRDVSGRVCYTQSLEKENTSIPVSAWARGMYMLHIISNKGNWVYRVVLSD